MGSGTNQHRRPVRRVLLADGDPASLSAARARLEAEGYSVTATDHGPAALAELERVPFSLVVMDLEIAGLDGLALLEALRQGADDVPVLATTADRDPGIAVRALAAGAFSVLTRPCDPHLLALTVRRADQLARLQEEVRGLRARQAGGEPVLVHRSVAMARVVDVAERVAVADATVLLEGETEKPGPATVAEVGPARIELPAEGVSLRQLERAIIVRALEMQGNNQSAAARFLRIPRHVLLYRIEKYGIPVRSRRRR